MPSLNDLGQFKFSFNSIGIEKDADGRPRKLPYDDLPLPTTEPPPMDLDSPSGDTDPGFDMNEFLGTIGDDSGSASTSEVDDILADLSNDITPPPPPLDDIPVVPDFSAMNDLLGLGGDPAPADEASMDDLLSGMDLGSEGLTDETPSLDNEPSMDDLLGDMNLGGDEPAPADEPSMDDLLGNMDLDSPADDSAEIESIDMGGESIEMTPSFEEPVTEDASLDNEPSMDDLLGGMDLESEDLGDETSSLDNEPSMDDLLGDMNLGGDESAPADEPSMDDLLGGMDLSGEEIPTEDSFTEEPAEIESIDMGGESLEMSPLTEEPIAEEPITDEFPMDDTPIDTGSMDDLLGDMDLGNEDFENEELGVGSEELGEETPLTEEFPADDFSDSSFNETSFDDLSAGGEVIDDPFASNDGINFGAEGDLPDDFSADSLGADSLGDSGLGEMDLGGEFETPSADSDFGDMDLGGEETPIPSDFGSDAAPLDLGDLGDDFSTDSIDLGSEAEAFSDLETGEFGGGGFGDMGSDDFALDGLDEIFEKTKVDPVGPPPKKESFFSKLKKKKSQEEDLPEPESDIEEIHLSEHDVEKLMATIASYPLNLRIACEELIAEQVILPQQLSKLLRCLIHGAHARETANLVEEITGKPVIIPKSYEKMTGAAFEAEQASFAYIFFHNFLPVFRLFAIIAALVASIAFLGYRFVYIPIAAENLYKRGYERIPEGEYQRANQLFDQAFAMHRKKKWFYSYAESFIAQRRFMLAEEKYDQLLFYYPRDKKGVLDYARLNTYYLLNYDKANRLLQQHLLDHNPNDYDGLLAAGDNFMLWADSDPERFYDRYEDARFHYARLLELRGWQVPIVERMLRYFIATDNLQRVLELRHWFDSDDKRNLSVPGKTDLAGYLLDKQMQEIKGVPDPYLEGIESVRSLLLEAIAESNPQLAGRNVKFPNYPEPHYHLARYHHNLGNRHEERLALENAIRAFNLAPSRPVEEGGGESVRRRQYRVDTHFRYSNLLLNSREFFPAEEQIVTGIRLYEDFLDRNLIRATATLPFSNTPQLGQLYAANGDIEYFLKSGDMSAALDRYHKAENYGYAPPEMRYRMGAAYYQLENWKTALEYLFTASKDLPLNRRMLYALGNAAYRRGDYFAAQGYYDRLLNILENQRVRLPVLLPNDSPQFLELGERLMMARNNMGVVYEALANQTGNREYRSRALSLYAESARSWDAITRNPETMIRMRLVDTPGAPGINQGYLNAHNAMRPNAGYTPQIFPRIDRDVEEPSFWEALIDTGDLQ